MTVRYENYNVLAADLYRTCLISDPWLEGRERFRLRPVLLDRPTFDRMCCAAEAIGRAYEELCQIVTAQPKLLDSFFHLTPYQKLMWLASAGQWHGIARLDMFVLPDGSLRMCEMNSDTPSGEAEAVILNRLLFGEQSGLVDPNAGLEERFADMVLSQGPPRPSIGIVYPTEMPEDLSMIRIYQQWLESRGCRVVLGSPFNLRPCPGGGVALFDTPIDILFRHYKTDWWSEREVVWTDEEPFSDPDPLEGPLRCVLDALWDGRLAIVNPFGSVLTQNKLSMAFMWEHMGLFSAQARNTIQNFIPETVRLSEAATRQVMREEWVLKSDYGCEGDEVLLGRYASEEVWRESAEKAISHRWILQKYFDAQCTDDGLIPNYGVYLVAGEPAGVYTRLSARVTDMTAQSAATYVHSN